MHSLIMGEYHSGKTEKALEIAAKYKNKINYITSNPFNSTIDKSINIINCSNNLSGLIESLSDTIIVDNIALFYILTVQNVLRNYDIEKSDINKIRKSIKEKRYSLLDSIKNHEENIIIISSIIGLSLIPPTKKEQIVFDELKIFNQELSNHCQRVYMVVDGIKITLKDNILEKKVNSKGTLYGVSVGPGSPDMITQKAIEILKKSPLLAIPETKNGKTIALDIISDVVDLNKKEIIKLHFPMSYNLKECNHNYIEISKKIANILDKGTDIAIPVLGDISIYSTFANFSQYVEKLGYKVKVIPGIPSFIAAADAFNLKLIKGSQTLTILSCKDPELKEKLQRDGKKVIMKIGKQLPMLKALLYELNMENLVHIALNIGMKEQRLETNLSQLSDDEGYLALILVDQRKN